MVKETGDPDRKTAPPKGGKGGKGGKGRGNWKRGGPRALHNEKVNVIDHTPFENNPALKDKEISDRTMKKKVTRNGTIGQMSN